MRELFFGLGIRSGTTRALKRFFMFEPVDQVQTFPRVATHTTNNPRKRKSRASESAISSTESPELRFLGVFSDSKGVVSFKIAPKAPKSISCALLRPGSQFFQSRSTIERFCGGGVGSGSSITSVDSAGSSDSSISSSGSGKSGKSTSTSLTNALGGSFNFP